MPGLKEKAIKAYQDDVTAEQARRIAEKKKTVEERLAVVREDICEAFGLETAPELTLIPKPTVYWPDCFFELEGLNFEYFLGNRTMTVDVICPKCNQDKWVGFGVPIRQTQEGLQPDLSQLGEALLWATDPERHVCPGPTSEAQPQPEPAPAPPARIVSKEERIGTAILEFLREEIDAGVEAVLDNRRD